ncbi:NADH dehydrogenase [ubiquinone] 1 alpha subcomplex subunit 10, mitochondrial [Coccinella septempunctata]|uniref:NADH dehydrogenase [ubiquinone] 1 alpha subcomplex subunit 10, mitochondrial n=1 Tax=Coccinella septempunctata TaxID=41139 RepID=UPI001D05D17F|nr:NADH dehydrogenase [ubiquinone] 1 alpha subcomplex subunit 10, mitochondrial [Coccinella septempunctata]
MASLVRISLRSIASPLTNQTVGKHDIKIVRTITSKLFKVVSPDDKPKPKPWPYKEKKYTFLHQFLDKTTSRFDENSKVIVVEGPIASGKSAFAKQLAEDLDMLYMPEANLDMVYINEYGFDFKSLDNQLPDVCKSFDVKNFLMNPRHSMVAPFQVDQYCIKFNQYIDALAHLFSTGQGVVLDRCCYSDFVFAEAMYSQGYISKGAYNAYYEVRDRSIDELLRPHLVIYLDIPVAKVQENIQRRNIPSEVKSPALTKEYLTALEKFYKQKYLKDISTHAELLVYDWSEGGDPEVVVEDIERIDFDSYDEQQTQMGDWVHENEEDWACLRRKYCNQKEQLMALTNAPMYNVPEMLMGPEEADLWDNMWTTAPGNKYEQGFNTDMGDKNILFKTKGKYRQTLPLRERRPF